MCDIDVTGPANDRPARHRGDRQAARRLGPARRRRVPANGVDARRRSARSPRCAQAPTPPRSSFAADADIDPDERRARLSVELDSGPAFRFGDIEVEGLSKYTPSLVRNYSLMERGEPYNETAVERFHPAPQRNRLFLERAGDDRHGRGEPRRSDVASRRRRGANQAASKAASATRRMSATRAKANYRDVNIDGHGLQMLADARIRRRDPGRIASLRAACQRGALDRDVDARREPHRHRRARDEDRERRHALEHDRRAATSARCPQSIISTTSSRTARPRAARTRSTSRPSSTGATSTCCSRRPRGWMGSLQLRRRRSRRLDARVRSRRRPLRRVGSDRFR